MSLLSKAINSVAVSLAGPIIRRRDDLPNHSSPVYRLYRFLSRAIKFSFYRTMQKDGDFTRSIYGVWLKRRDDNTYTYCVNGSYGFAYSEHLKKIRHDFTFLDIGSNIGLYSLVALRNSNCKDVHCFDPDSATIPFLTANLQRTEKSIFRVHPYAVSSSAGTAILNKESGHSGASTLATPTFESSAAETVTTVDHNYLDELLAHTQRPIYLKLDVEGHEMTVLTTLAQSSIINQVKEVFAEFNPAMSDTKAMQQWFTSNGFIQKWRIGSDQHWDALYSR